MSNKTQDEQSTVDQNVLDLSDNLNIVRELLTAQECSNYRLSTNAAPKRLRDPYGKLAANKTGLARRNNRKN